jgi:hypothetical protein
MVPVIAEVVKVKAPAFSTSTMKLLVDASLAEVTVTVDPETAQILTASEKSPGTFPVPTDLT